jgi:hypothetical protein
MRSKGISGENLKKILEYSQPSGDHLREPRPKPKIGPYLERMVQIIEEDKAHLKKQGHATEQLCERLRDPRATIPIKTVRHRFLEMQKRKKKGRGDYE